MIKEFKGEYKFLSNFFYTVLDINGFKFPTSEHYFQAMKATCYEDYLLIAQCNTPGEAKKLGRTISVRPDWDDVKLQIMEYALYVKFKDDPLKSKLLSTGDEELIEGNWWNDTYWGICLKTNVGENHLGKLLMKLRSYLRSIEESVRYHGIESLNQQPLPT